MSRVFFLKADDVDKEDKFESLLDRAGIGMLSGIVAVKMHMGERNNRTYIKPERVKPIIEAIKRHGGMPFVTDTTTIYKEKRYTAMDYYETAFAHGFLPSVLGCPVLIADGLKDDGVPVSESGHVEIARYIYESDSMLVITHATGHGASSFGGAIKNVAMGCVTKRTKKYMHEVTKPVLNQDLCTGCDKCREACRHDAITITESHTINFDKCVGCGACIAVCESGALSSPPDMSPELQKRLAEVASTVIHALPYRNLVYLNFLMDITPYCDCAEFAPEYICPDIGVLASRDIVALDMATIELINADKFSGDPSVQVREAHRLGLGELRYELVSI